MRKTTGQSKFLTLCLSAAVILSQFIAAANASAKPKRVKEPPLMECRLQHQIGNFSVKLTRFVSNNSALQPNFNSMNLRYDLQTSGKMKMYSTISRSGSWPIALDKTDSEKIVASWDDYMWSGLKTLKVWNPDVSDQELLIETNDYTTEITFGQLAEKFGDTEILHYQFTAPGPYGEHKLETATGMIDRSDHAALLPAVKKITSLMDEHSADTNNNCTPTNSKKGFRLLTFDCDLTFQRGDDRYTLTNQRFYWRRELGDKVSIEFHEDYTPAQNLDFLSFLPSFDTLTSPLWINFEKRWGTKNFYTSQSGWSRYQLAEFRSGKVVYRNWLPSNTVLGVRWYTIPQFLNEQENFKITAHDQSTGETLRKEVEHGFLNKVTADLKASYQTMLENSRFPEKQCKRVLEVEDNPDDIIVVT